MEVNKTKLLQSLYNFGHFWGKEELREVTPDNLHKLDLNHKLVQDAVLSWQMADANFDALSFIGYLRGIVAGEGGDVGPVTRFMLDQVKRCPMPDNPPPPNASFDYGDSELNEAVRSYQIFAEEYKGGSGSWPKCDPERPDVHSVRVAINIAAASDHQKSIMDATLKMVEACEAEMGQSVRHIIGGDPDDAEHDVRFQFIAGSTIGFAYFPRPNTCSQTVTARIDNSFNVNAHVFSELLVHEYKGHSDGLEHSRGGIMNPSIGRPTSPPSWKGDPHESTKRRYFGGVPVPPKDGPTDPPPPPPPIGDVNGVFTFQGKIFKIKVFE